MKLASFEDSGGRRSFGVVASNGWIADLGTDNVATLRAALKHWGLQGIAERARSVQPSVRSGTFVLLPPITDPDKVICVGLNYRDHVAEADRALPAYPSMFVRFGGSQVGHGTPTQAPVNSKEYDYEAELALVIGTGGRHIPESDAMSVVAGYSCFAENSARDFQRHAAQATAGKNFEASGAFGPWLTTVDEVRDPATLRVIGRLNGTVMQDAPVSDLIFSIPKLIAYISSFTRLLPGDVIVTGTPSGVGAVRKPPIWLKQGDVFEVNIEGVGLLRNEVANEEVAQ